MCKPKNIAAFKTKIEMKKKIIQEKLSYLQNTPGSSKTEIQTLKTLDKELSAEEKNGPKTRTNIVWPASTAGGEPRTNANMLEIVEKIAENPNLEKEERKGVVGRSPLWDIPRFDFVRDSPTEYMHSTCIGVVKRLLELTFSVGEVRQRITKRKLSSPTEFNLCMQETKSPRESSRRARKLDFAVMKAQEMRNIILLYFPHVLQCIEPKAKERRVWLLLAFITRSCVMPTNEAIDLNAIDAASQEFYCQLHLQYSCCRCTHN